MNVNQTRCMGRCACAQQSEGKIRRVSIQAAWTKLLSAIFLCLLSVSVSAQVIDFGNVTPDQGAGHGGPITASGPDGVQVTVEFINIETAEPVPSGLFSAQDCTGTQFGGSVFFTGDATAGCAIGDFSDNKFAVRLTFSEPIDVNKLYLSSHCCPINFRPA